MKKSEFKKFLTEQVPNLKEGQKIIFSLTPDGYEIFIHRVSEDEVFIYVPSSHIWEAVKIDLGSVDEKEIWEIVSIFIERFCSLSDECLDEQNIIVYMAPHF